MLIVRTMENLPTVKVSLSPHDEGKDRGSPAIEFEVGRGRRVLTRFTVDQAKVGIPPGFDPGSYRGEEPRFRIAGDVAARLAGAGIEYNDDNALWLQLASPIGYLAALPWESMLRPAFRGWPSILRIPDFTLVSERDAGPATVVLCASEPAVGLPGTAQPITEFLPRFLDALESDAVVHLFTDLSSYLSLRGLGLPGLVLHDPKAMEGSGDPWLSWVRQEMSGTTVDVLHFLAHGYVTGGQPALAVAESPISHHEGLWARFISPSQLSACLTDLGAWAAAFSAPPRNFSPLGLRMFADGLARLRPGPVHCEDNPSDRYSRPYAGLLDRTRPRLGSGSFLYVHPRLAGLHGQADYAESLVREGLGPARGNRGQQPWATTTRRYLEQSAAQMFPRQSDPGSAEEAAIGEGVRNALTFVNGVIRDHEGRQA